MDEFIFYKTNWRRNKTEMMHDLLTVAKKGIIPTRLMYGTGLCWKSMHELLKIAKAAGLIEEIEATEELMSKRYWRKKPIIVWKTTDKGLKYAKGIYDNYKLLKEIET